MKVQLTIDLKAVAYISFYYKNREGKVSRTKPRKPTVHGVVVKDEVAPIHPDFPNETMLDRAKRLGIVDVWTPVCMYHMRNNHSLKFTGDEAKRKHKAYSAHIYGK